MNTIPEPYILVSRADLSLSHITHRNGSRCLCVSASAEDWVKVQAVSKPICRACLQALPDWAYRDRVGRTA